MVDNFHDLVLCDQLVKLGQQEYPQRFNRKLLSHKIIWKIGAAIGHREKSVPGSALFRRNTDAFPRQYVTVDKTWIPFYSPKISWKSKQLLLLVNQLRRRKKRWGPEVDGHGFSVYTELSLSTI